MKKIIFLCQDNKLSLEAIRFLMDSGIRITSVIVDAKSDGRYLEDYLELVDISIYVTQDLRTEKLDKYRSVDVLISFMFPRFITEDFVKKAKYAINFHPAPLPEFRGCATTSHGILQGKTEWGVTCHFIEKEFDSGDIVKRLDFKIDTSVIRTGRDLSIYSRDKCLLLLKDVIGDYLLSGEIKGEPQHRGDYYSKKLLCELKEVKITEAKDIIDKKINAFWYPPYEGAYIVLDGKKFYLINENILDEYNRLLKKDNRTDRDYGDN